MPVSKKGANVTVDKVVTNDPTNVPYRARYSRGRIVRIYAIVTLGAHAEADTAGTVNNNVSFHNGLAVFQMTESGLVASADISGTKYWKNKKLNK